MSYEGNPIWPTAYPLVSDETTPTATQYNPALEALGDRTAYLKDNLTSIESVTFTAGYEEIVVPKGATHAIVEGWGGGGGGGKGRESGLVSRASSGGGGGGGAIAGVKIVPVTEGETLGGEIGPGGDGGTVNAGQAGGDTKLTRVSDSAVLVTFRGAGPGQKGTEADFFVQYPPGVSDAPNYTFGFGGEPVATSTFFQQLASGTPFANMYRTDTPQAGGLGTSSHVGLTSVQMGRGNSSPHGTVGGAGGSGGGDAGAGAFKGGGGGGGGGAGPGGNGGAGGNGSSAVAAGSSTNGGGGANAAANSGAGGGGGGGAGGAPSAGGVGGAGGKGGSGWMRVTFIRRGSV